MQKQALEFYEDSETGESLPPIKNSALDSRTCLYFEEAGNSGFFKGACLPAACYTQRPGRMLGRRIPVSQKAG